MQKGFNEAFLVVRAMARTVTGLPSFNVSLVKYAATFDM